MTIIIAIGLATALLLWILSGYLTTRNIAMPAYTVVAAKQDYEIRSYEPFIVAETLREGNPAEALSAGFNELFRYITGTNAGNSKIKMTAPVLRSPEQQGTKIPMTAPVLRQGAGTGTVIAFIMPPGSTLERLPRPTSPAVTLREVPARSVAVVTFSGYATEGIIKEKTESLLHNLKRDGMTPRAEPGVALYDPPWTPPFMRRNEILVEIMEGSAGG
jgi:DNA gyrase inhibitor GyrI